MQLSPNVHYYIIRGHLPPPSPKTMTQMYITNETAKLPPPDPAYNFLKDPLRGDTIRESNHKRRNKQDNRHINEQKPKGVRELLKQPVNINVEVSSNSGERKCTLDESKTVEIPAVQKHYPKRPQFRRAPGELNKHYNGRDEVFEHSKKKGNESGNKDTAKIDTVSNQKCKNLSDKLEKTEHLDKSDNQKSDN
ncbi:hypothetical protein FQR65_LT13096 [Abscondita terminalis]|nr:hypothetical protein FQR65_LT13096 [Abscondita terminalis]